MKIRQTFPAHETFSETSRQVLAGSLMQSRTEKISAGSSAPCVDLISHGSAAIVVIRSIFNPLSQSEILGKYISGQAEP